MELKKNLDPSFLVVGNVEQVRKKPLVKTFNDEEER